MTNTFKLSLSLLCLSVTFLSCNSEAENTNTTYTSSQVVPVNIAQPSTIEAVKAAGLPLRTGLLVNPPHGQPGHTCDLEVGAPFPTKSTAAPATVATETSPLKALAPVKNTVTSNLKLNPEHGQPGHVCSIPVGDPLPAAAAAQSPEEKAPVKLNPAHGQPGHDCAVEVGAPLPSK